MTDQSFMSLPFFDATHRRLATELTEWCATALPVLTGDVDADCRSLVRYLGEAGWLESTAIDPTVPTSLNVRSLCVIREVLARHDGLADFAFAMQGLGAGAISLYGTEEQRQWLDLTRKGKAIAAFALTETKSGSDVANIETSAVESGDSYLISGEKTWISNGGIADFYVVFCRTGECGHKGISAFLIPARIPGLRIAERLETVSPHPLARLSFENVKVPSTSLIGNLGEGFRIAMSVLDIFRVTVGAAALGFARRALSETLQRVISRQLFGQSMSDFQMIRGHLADMAQQIDASALLVYRAAWLKDSRRGRFSREASMAKLFATEEAQQVVDRAVQLHGGDGVRKGHIVERLYRDVRALRIYEGASDLQRLIIAADMLPNGTKRSLRARHRQNCA